MLLSVVLWVWVGVVFIVCVVGVGGWLVCEELLGMGVEWVVVMLLVLVLWCMGCCLWVMLCLLLFGFGGVVFGVLLVLLVIYG